MDIYKFGRRKIGLDRGEIREYLWLRAKDCGLRGYSKGSLFRQFIQRMGGGHTHPMDKKQPHITLTYRHDVERFADAIFMNKPTYFD